MTVFVGTLLAIVIRYFLYIVEAAAVVFLVRTALRHTGEKWFRGFGCFHWLARRRKLAIVTVGILPLAIRTALLPILPLSRLSWKWKGRSTVKIAERAREETTKALQRRREGRHFEAALAGTGAGFQAL